MNKYFAVLLANISLLIVGCTVAQMRVPNDLFDVQAFLVVGANPRFWNTPIAFGHWSTVEANSGYTWNFGYRLLGINVEYIHHPYRFALDLNNEIGLAECLTRGISLEKSDLRVDPGYGNIPVLRCGFTGMGEGTLHLVASGFNSESGDIRFGANHWQIQAIKNYANSSLQSVNAIGYEILAGDKVIAAVETINQGRVWITPTLSENDQDRIALAATALLMYQPLDGIEDELDSIPD